MVDESGAAPRNRYRDMALFFVGAFSAPLLLTGLYRVTPTSVPLWLPDLVLLAIIAVLALVLKWKWIALGMFVSGLTWVVFIVWLTARVTPDF